MQVPNYLKEINMLFKTAIILVFVSGMGSLLSLAGENVLSNPKFETVNGKIADWETQGEEIGRAHV